MTSVIAGRKATSSERLGLAMAGIGFAVMHDGGIPVDGFARAVDEEHWDDVARRFLRT